MMRNKQKKKPDFFLTNQKVESGGDVFDEIVEGAEFHAAQLDSQTQGSHHAYGGRASNLPAKADSRKNRHVKNLGMTY